MMTSVGAQSGASHFFLNLLRIGVAMAFMQHGAQKLFGLLGAEGSVTFATQLWLAGTLEFWGGLLILVGLFTRPVAFILAAEMAWAYLQAHHPHGFFPVVNGGELAVLFCLIYLFLASNGGGAFSIDGLIEARRRRRTAG